MVDLLHLVVVELFILTCDADNHPTHKLHMRRAKRTIRSVLTYTRKQSFGVQATQSNRLDVTTETPLAVATNATVVCKVVVCKVASAKSPAKSSSAKS